MTPRPARNAVSAASAASSLRCMIRLIKLGLQPGFRVRFGLISRESVIAALKRDNTRTSYDSARWFDVLGEDGKKLDGHSGLNDAVTMPHLAYATGSMRMGALRLLSRRFSSISTAPCSLGSSALYRDRSEPCKVFSGQLSNTKHTIHTSMLLP